MTDTVKQYWRIEKVFQTDSNGVITTPTEGLRYGTYTMMEVQAPVGYKVNNNGFSEIEYKILDANNVEHTETHTDSGQLLITLDETHVSCNIIHKDERKNAKVDIFKKDEFGNPLDDAEFKLYYRPNGNPSPVRPVAPSPDSKVKITPKSDNDYVFFMDNRVDSSQLWVNATISSTYDPANRRKYGQVEITNTADQMHYQFYDSDGNLVGSEGNAWEKYGYFETDYTDSSKKYCVVYKAPVPDNAVSVRFFSKGSNIQSTVKFDIVKGAAYKKSVTKDGNDYNVVAWDRSTGNQISNPAAASSTVSFVPSGNKIVVRLNSYYDWDDLHVYFWDANNNDVGQPFPGYSLENYNYYDGKFPPEFQLDIPEGAVNFQFNNGVKPNDTLNQYQTKDGYQILNENKENGGNFYEFTSSSPVASNYDRQRFELQQWNYTGTITDPDHESDYDP